MSEYKKPLPLLTKLSKVFYDGCKENKLLYQKCKDCGEVVFFPKELCSNCMSHNLEWVESRGKGKLHTFTVTYAGAPPAFTADGPYVLAIIEMDEGFRLMSNVVECDFAKLSCDMPVEVVFDPVTPEITLPKFRPVEREARRKPGEQAPGGAEASAGKIRDKVPRKVFTSVQEIFVKMPKFFNPKAAEGLAAVFQYIIEGGEGGAWHIVVHEGTCTVSEGKHDSPSVSLTMRDKDFLALCNGELDSMAAVAGGKLKLSGDIMLAQRLARLFPVG